MTEYAHIIKKDNKITAIYNNEVDNGNELLRAHPTGSTISTVEHLDTTFTYELVDGNITPVTLENIYARMNDPDDTSVQIPSE
jgi:hypothetical protein